MVYDCIFTYLMETNKRIKRGEIYYADLSPAVGSEQGGIHPVLILQNNIGNQASPTTIVAVIASREKKRRWSTHVNLTTAGLKTQSTVLLEQIRTIDKIRLAEYIGRLDKETYGQSGSCHRGQFWYQVSGDAVITTRKEKAKKTIFLYYEICLLRLFCKLGYLDSKAMNGII